MKTLTKLRTHLYHGLSEVRRAWYVRVWGMDIGIDCRISGSAKLDKTNPRGIHVGNHTLISFEAAILTHDFVGGKHVDTFIGDNCFIGAKSVVMPGIRIGNNCIVGAGSVVTADIPANSIVVGNPARVIQSNVTTGRWGIRNPKFLAQEGIALVDAKIGGVGCDADHSPALAPEAIVTTAKLIPFASSRDGRSGLP